MAFPKPEDYDTYEGERGSPEQWVGQSEALLQLRLGRTDALKALGFHEYAEPSQAEVKTAYKRTMLEVHPDQGGTVAAAQFANEAFKILGGGK